MNKVPKNIIVGISVGDVNGVGVEVILKTFEDVRMLELCTPVIFANARLLSFIKRAVNSNAIMHGIDHLNLIVPNKLNVLNVWRDSFDLNVGKSSPVAGEYAIKSLTTATRALKNSEIDVLVTAPINKANVQSENFKYAGHTDYLAHELGGKALMLMVNGSLRVGLLTDHVPLKDVNSYISEELIINKVETIKQTLIQDFGVLKPKIAVLGLNPHAGDGGVIGKEEGIIFKSAIAKMYGKNILVFGPFAADGFFGSEAYKKYDAVIAAYHDQGLIPFKTLSFGNGVNFTAGLSKIRTSPDHGTAYDIAGKGTADFSSFREAVYTAIDIYKSREDYKESSKNPLKITQREGQEK